MTPDNQYLQDIITVHQDAHRQMREAITGLETDALNWTPAPDTSSIGTVITHVLGAQAEMLRNLLNIPTDRDRAAEFAPRTHELTSLLNLLDAADDDLQQLASRLQEEHLRTSLPRPNKPVPQSGLFWLVRNYGHIREHLAQVRLTRQLYQLKDQEVE